VLYLSVTAQSAVATGSPAYLVVDEAPVSSRYLGIPIVNGATFCMQYEKKGLGYMLLEPCPAARPAMQSLCWVAKVARCVAGVVRKVGEDGARRVRTYWCRTAHR
jgi:hypothetical protein